jgi:hypothetical protein
VSFATVNCRKAELEFTRHRTSDINAILLIGGFPVIPETYLRECCNFARQLLRGGTRLAGRNDTVNQTDREGFFGIHGTAGQYDIQRSLEANKPRQPDRAAIDQRNAPAPAEDDQSSRPPATACPEIAAMTGLVSLMRVGPTGASAADGSAGSVGGVSRLPLPEAIAFRSAPAQNVPPSPQKDSYVCRTVIFEAEKRLGERVSGLRVDGVARFRPRQNDGGDWAFAFKANR